MARRCPAQPCSITLSISLSLVRTGRIEADSIWELKTQAIKKSGLLALYRSNENFESLGGMAALKAFSRRSLLRPGREDPRRRARGVMLLGIPGTGKSAFAKALGAETHRPTLVLDIGSLMGSLVGRTEQNIRQALAIADAMAPCILFCDEIEKRWAVLPAAARAIRASRPDCLEHCSPG
jgi:SpoVK/Ycf46/Vps4 family AAA+-type ATPase